MKPCLIEYYAAPAMPIFPRSGLPSENNRFRIGANAGKEGMVESVIANGEHNVGRLPAGLQLEHSLHVELHGSLHQLCEYRSALLGKVASSEA